ncbi:hypothetical protein GBA52_011702 [Prunus armeniaca]|nr:hypothetical protein GBA52_011702 [Prunus armeniaca]
MASTTSTLSWSSSLLLQSFAANTNEACKLSNRRTGLVVFAQKKAKKARTLKMTLLPLTLTDKLTDLDVWTQLEQLVKLKDVIA